MCSRRARRVTLPDSCPRSLPCRSKVSSRNWSSSKLGPGLVNRFKETRRKHPLLPQAGGILPSLEQERSMLTDLKARADRVIDTSDHTPRSLRCCSATSFQGNHRSG